MSLFRVCFASGGEAPVLLRAQGGGNAEHEAQKVCTAPVHEATRVRLRRGQGTPKLFVMRCNTPAAWVGMTQATVGGASSLILAEAPHLRSPIPPLTPDFEERSNVCAIR